MADGIKVADLYAALGVQPDLSSFRKAERQLTQLEKSAGRAGARAGKGFWGSMLGAGPGGKGFRGMMGKSVGSARGAVGGMGALGMSPAALAGMLGVGSGVAAGRDALKFDEQLTGLDIASKGAMGSLDDVRTKVLAVSRATGVAKEEILSGAQAFVALTGDGDAASKAMETFAKVQKATGAQTNEVAATAAALSQQLGVSGGDMEKAFSILARGGKEGAVEFSDMASLMASLSASFKGFGSSQGLAGVAQLGAMFQIARQDFGSADQTATGMERLMESISSPRTLKAAKKFGIEFFDKAADGSVKMKPLAEIITQLDNAGIVKDPRKINALFESSEARRAARAILNNVDAVRQLAASTMQANDIAEDYAKRQASSSARVTKSFNGIKVAITEAFNPDRLQGFATALEVIIDREGKALAAASKLAGRIGEALGGEVSSEGKLIQTGALRDFQKATGLTSEQIAKMSPEDIQARAFQAFKDGNWAMKDLSEDPGRRGGQGVIEAATRDLELDRKAVAERDMRENTLEAITARATAVYQPTAPGMSTPTFNNTNNITVHTTGGDANEIAKVVNDRLQFWSRDMAASLGQ